MHGAGEQAKDSHLSGAMDVTTSLLDRCSAMISRTQVTCKLLPQSGS